MKVSLTTKDVKLWIHDNLLYCACGVPESVVRLFYDVMNAIYMKWAFHDRGGTDEVDNWHAEIERLLKYEKGGENGLYWFFLYMLDHWGLTEHGGSVAGSWLSPDGDELFRALRRMLLTGEETCGSIAEWNSYQEEK